MSVKAETLFCSKVKNDLRNLAKDGHPVWFKKTQEVSRRGMPDFICCIAGRFVALELKTEEGVADPLQIVVSRSITTSGGMARIVRPSQWNLVLQEIKELL